MNDAVSGSALEPAILEPPKTVLGSIQYLGPGLILSAAIVGSGELIMTTTLGADAGFALLWVILLGCFVKVAVQLEYGKYSIVHGTATFESWNNAGHVHFFGLHWSVHVGLLFMLSHFAGQAGVLGGSAQVGTYFFPGTSTGAWVLTLVIITGLLVFHGKYAPVEITATVLNGIFVLLVLACVVMVQQTDAAFSISDIANGFNIFHLPPDLAGAAFAAFGITGVAAGEVAMYPYWCIEKGYARWTGPNDGSEDWVRRAKGWIRVMTLDALVSMVIYTLTTCAFYALGATILSAHKDKLVDNQEFILSLSVLFTEVLGKEAQFIFMICAFTVLYSTIFANTAGFSRLWTDFFGLIHKIDIHNQKQRAFSIGLMAFLFPTLCGLVYMTVPNAFFLVQVMGISNALFLIVVAYQAVVFRYYHTDPKLQPSIFYDMAFWLSLASIAFMAGRAVYSLF